MAVGERLEEAVDAGRLRQPRPSNPYLEFPREDLELSIPARFEKLVRRFPGRCAVRSTRSELSYSQLNELADRLAHAIAKSAGESSNGVGLLIEQGASLVAAVMGILKANRFYVPLDASFPFERNQFIVGDSQADLIVTNGRNLELARSLAGEGIAVIRFDELPVDSARTGAASLPSSGLRPEAPAFITYTSGSTGEPKGVVQYHGSMLQEIMKYTNAFHICPDDRLLLIRPWSGVASSVDMFSALLTGASLYPFDLQFESFSRLADWIGENELNIYHSVPTVFRHFMDSLDPGSQFPSVRLVRLGGDVSDRRDFELYKQHFAEDCLFANVLGTTETLTYSSFVADKSTRFSGNTTPVGYPMEDAELHLLDDEGCEVPNGQVGEIVVRSRYLTLGYWRRPELTEALFRPPPDGRQECVYFTGDLGRRGPDGCLVQLGRKDFQVKVRGYRVEPSEVEVALRGSECVKDVVVLAVDAERGDHHLVAYWVPATDPPVSVAELRAAVSRRLPSYMVPSSFVCMDEIPLLATGKVDRSGLPATSLTRPELESQFLAARSPLEETLARYWRELLQVDRVGIRDDFFELGGHSLSAIMLASRLRADLGVDLSLKSFFERPTIEAIAVRIEEGPPGMDPGAGPGMEPGAGPGMDPGAGPGMDPGAGPGPAATIQDSAAIRPTGRAGCLAPLRRCDRSGALPLSAPQSRLWFLSQYESEKSTYNIAAAFQLQGELDVPCLERSLGQLVARHESLRTTFPAERGVPRQSIAVPGAFALRVERLETFPRARRHVVTESLVREEARLPFDLAQGPLFRGVLIRRDPTDHTLLLTMHHIVADGWSMGVLVRELSALYEADLEGVAPRLPELSVQYADVASWWREWEAGPGRADQQRYWLKELEGEIAPLELPFDRPRPRVRSSRGAARHSAVSDDLAGELGRFCRDEGVTLFMLLLASFQAFLHRTSGQQDVAVGYPVANRGRVEFESIVGFFVNTLVLRTHFSGNESFREHLERVRDKTIEAMAHQDLPFDKLVEALRPKREMGLTPLFQVLLDFQEDVKERFCLGDVDASQRWVDSEAAKYDLLLQVRSSEAGITMWWEYDIDLFDPDTIREMDSHFHAFLEAMLGEPGQEISRISLGADEQAPRMSSASPPAANLPTATPDQCEEAPIDGPQSGGRGELDPVASVVGAVVAELLELDRVEGEDDFFELGGHSLLIAQMTSRLQEVFAVELPFRAVFEARTISNMARALRQYEAKSGQVERMAHGYAEREGRPHDA